MLGKTKKGNLFYTHQSGRFFSQACPEAERRRTSDRPRWRTLPQTCFKVCVRLMIDSDDIASSMDGSDSRSNVSSRRCFASLVSLPACSLFVIDLSFFGWCPKNEVAVAQTHRHTVTQTKNFGRIAKLQPHPIP